MDDYKDIKNQLKPRRDFVASEILHEKVNLLLDNHSLSSPFRWIWRIGVSCVAVAVLILFLMPSGMSAKEILRETLNALLNEDRIEMTIQVRTRPIENFRYIDLDEDFVTHNVTIAKTDSMLIWRIDKGGRTAVGNNGVIYHWINDLKIGWKFVGQDPKELLGDISVFLTPDKIIESELRNCMDSPSSEYRVSKKDGEIRLTVHSMPMGDFSNPYMLNASIAESENIRRYVIDPDSKCLKSASVSIVDSRGKEIEVLKITEIKYSHARDNIAAIPDDIRYIDTSQASLPGLRGLSATEAASVFLNSLESWDKAILEKAIDRDVLSSMYEYGLKGAILVSIGDSFVSGNENTTFVPYTLRFRDGSMKSHNLVMQQNHNGGWIVVGGL